MSFHFLNGTIYLIPYSDTGPGTIIVEFLDPIPPGLPRAEFLARLTSAIETASDRLIAEAKPKEAGSTQGVNL